MQRLRRLLGVLMAAGSIASSAWAQNLRYSVTSVPLPNGYPIWSISGGGINDAGQIVGTIVILEPYAEHGFIYDHGTFTILDVPLPRTNVTEANGINNLGEVVGTYASDDECGAFVWSRGVFTTFHVPYESRCTQAFGVNDDGAIVGSYVDARTDAVHAFLFSGGRFTTIDPPGAIFGVGPPGGADARDINNVDQIVGNYSSETGIRGFLYEAGRFTDIELSLPDVDDLIVLGINDNGDIVGHYSSHANVNGFHTFLTRGGISHSIEIAPEQESPFGVNASGQIFGRLYDNAHGYRLYLASPFSSEVTLVDDSVTFVPISSTYSIAGACSIDQWSTGQLFKFVARLTVLDHATAFSDAFIRLVAFSANSYASVGALDARGALTILPFEGAFASVPRIGQYADGLLTPGESVDVTFGVCLPSPEPFELFVDVWGRPQS